MNKSQRLLAIIMTLNTKGKFTAARLADEFQVSRRTILRDLQELSELGIPLYSEMGVYGGYQVLSERTLPPVAFTENETLALFFACQSLQNYRSLPFEKESRTALKKFYRHLPDDMKSRIDQLQSKLLFLVPPHSFKVPFLSTLLHAALDGLVLTVEYESETSIKQRDIQPLGLYTMNGLWYCPSLDCRTNKILTLRSDRFLSVQVSPLPAKKG